MQNSFNSSEGIKISFDDNKLFSTLCGEHDENIKLIQRLMSVEIFSRGNQVTIRGDSRNSRLAEALLRQIYKAVKKGATPGTSEVSAAANMLLNDENVKIDELFFDTIVIPSSGVRISPKSTGQKEYIDSIKKHDLVFAIGPAGTGKTYLAMVMAVTALLNKEKKRIILTRPAVEAGEKLGFLPGSIAEKVNPYLRPLYDAMHDLMDLEKAYKLIERELIEVAPLAFMRGRTLNDSFVILDEAQNTTVEQMKMFLTRLGFSSKVVVTGDITQIDLQPDKQSGLTHAIKILDGIEGIKFCFLTEKDVVRHPLVTKIIKAYEEDNR